MEQGGASVLFPQKRDYMADSQAKKDWFKENTTFIGLKLNNRTDLDILNALDGKQKQTEIKRLIREGLKAAAAP